MGETCQNDPILDFIAFRKERGEKKKKKTFDTVVLMDEHQPPRCGRLREPEKILIGREREKITFLHVISKGFLMIKRSTF